MYLLTQRSPAFLGQVRTSRRRRFSGLGQGTGAGGATWSLSDLFSAAATGDVPADVVSQLTQNETASLTQAGLSPDAAASQASSDVTGALSTYSGPGAFGVSWTGAAPGQTLPAAIGSGLAAIPNWAWWIAGGIGIFFLVEVVRRH